MDGASARRYHQRPSKVLVQQSGGSLGGQIPHGIGRKSKRIRQFVVQRQHLPQQRIAGVAPFHAGDVAQGGEARENRGWHGSQRARNRPATAAAGTVRPGRAPPFGGLAANAQVPDRCRNVSSGVNQGLRGSDRLAKRSAIVFVGDIVTFQSQNRSGDQNQWVFTRPAIFARD